MAGWQELAAFANLGDHKIFLETFLQRVHLIACFHDKSLVVLQLCEYTLFLVLITLVLFKDYRIIGYVSNCWLSLKTLPKHDDFRC